MAVRRRVIWMSDDEWFLIRRMAIDRNETVSQLIRSMWTEAAASNPEPPEEVARSYEALAQARTDVERYDVRPIRPVPKTRK